MSDENPTLKDIWRLLGTFNKRFDVLTQRLDAHERQFVALSKQMAVGFGSLKASIEALDFRLDEHGRRLNELESKG